MEIDYLKEAIQDSNTSCQGENVKKLQLSLENYIGKPGRATLLNSGTSAIHLALILAGVTYGDEVICQSFTFCASVNPIKYLGAIPIFVDSETVTWGICPDYLELCIKNRISKGKKPKAIIFANNYGMPAQIDRIRFIANLYEISLIEDSASALGSEYKTRKCGGFGDFSIFSFNSNKIITTTGGGLLVCPDIKTKNEAIKIANQSKDEALHYQHSKLGYNYRMSNVNAAIGRAQFNSLEELINKKRKINSYYVENLISIPGITIMKEPSADFYSNFWLNCILIEENVTGYNWEYLQEELESKNIETRPLWKPMHLQPLYKNQLYFGGINSEMLFNKGLCLPSSSCLSNTDLRRIINVIENTK